MSWLGMVAAILGLFVAYKVAGVVMKLVACCVLVVGAWWWLAPRYGWPTPLEVAMVFSPW